MNLEHANFSILLLSTAHPIRFDNIADFLRIMHEDNFEQLSDIGVLKVYKPTKERQRGENSYLYIVENGLLKHNTVTQLNGIND